VFDVRQDPVDGDDLGRFLDLGQDQARQPRAGHGQDVVEAEIRIPGIDPHIAALARVLFQGFDDQGAGRRFLGDSDGVFQVQNDGVAIKGERLFGPACVVSGGKQIGTMNGHESDIP